MDDLDTLFEETGVDPNVQLEVPKGAPKDKDGQSSSTRKDQKSKPSLSNTGKAADGKPRKRKESERGTPKTAVSSGPSKPAGAEQSVGEKSRGARAHADKKMKSVVEYDPNEEVTAVDFAVMARIARLGAEGFNKMRKAVQVNTPDNLAELLKESRALQAEAAKNAELLKKLYAAEKEAAENKQKAADLERITGELETAREKLVRAKKDAEDTEIFFLFSTIKFHLGIFSNRVISLIDGRLLCEK